MFDILIIGGGASGIMTAIVAKRHSPSLKVLVLEKNEKIGKKLLVSGAGRCNISNINLSTQNYHSGDSRLVASVIKRFNSKRIIDFFDELGVDLYEEQKNAKSFGKLYPVTNRSDTVVKLLELELEALNIEVIFGSNVIEVEKKDHFIIKTDSKSFQAKKVVVATGGLSYPSLGADGIGFEIAKKFGHDVVKPVPSGCSLFANHWIISRLSGYKLEMEVIVYINSLKSKKVIDEVLFTNYGLSGSAIFALSRDVSIRLNRQEKNDIELNLNFFPNVQRKELEQKMQVRWKKRANQASVSALYGLLPNKVIEAIYKYLKIDLVKTSRELASYDRQRLFDFLTNFSIKVKKTADWQEAEFSSGGVSTNEIRMENLESKLVPNLFFTGEIIDVDGDIGGYNLAWAWATGWVVGSSISQ